MYFLLAHFSFELPTFVAQEICFGVVGLLMVKQY